VETKLLATDTPAQLAAAVEAAAAALAAGEPVALPTETVYGLAADALRPDAVVKIFAAKERPFFDPLIVHLPDREWLDRLVIIADESRALVEALIARFWPGPLTLVLPRRALVPDLVTAGLDTVAVRLPAHPVFRAVLARLGMPLAAPSANRFGRISPTTAAHVRSELDGRIPLIVDGGATEHGLESTIVRIESSGLQILRAGPITPGQLMLACRENLIETGAPTAERNFPQIVATLEQSPALRPQAPGQLQSHYAPRTPLRLLLDLGQPVSISEVAGQPSAQRVGLLGWSRVGGEDYSRFQQVEWLSETQDLREAAATLFAKMRRLDEAGLDLILAVPVPEHGLGIAIMDRLRKAAAEHE